jgi:tetratricopeptide (TPR) repeat protein
MEELMRHIRLFATTLVFSFTMGAADIASAMGIDNPAPPQQPQTQQPQTQQPSQSHKEHTKKSKPKKNSAIDKFYAGYHSAYAQIYDNKDYAGGIVTLRALGYDDNPDVATLIGYASRKLGRYDDAKYWYEKALAADPNHALTWSYYGAWQAEQGNLLKAKDDLEKVRVICGSTNCPEYRQLKGVIDGTATY